MRSIVFILLLLFAKNRSSAGQALSVGCADGSPGGRAKDIIKLYLKGVNSPSRNENVAAADENQKREF